MSSAGTTLPKLPSPDEVIVNSKGAASDSKIGKDSPAAKGVNDWLAQHQSGWHTTYVTYVPLDVVKGKGYELNFSSRACILNYQSARDQAWHQIMREMKPGESEPAVFGH